MQGVMTPVCARKNIIYFFHFLSLFEGGKAGRNPETCLQEKEIFLIISLRISFTFEVPSDRV